MVLIYFLWQVTMVYYKYIRTLRRQPTSNARRMVLRPPRHPLIPVYEHLVWHYPLHMFYQYIEEMGQIVLHRISISLCDSVCYASYFKSRSPTS